MIDAASLLRAVRDALRADPALATELRAALGVDAADPWLSLAEAGSVARVRARVIADAAARGELVLGAAGRRPVVRRSELDRWIASRRAPQACGTPADDYERVVGGAR